MCGIVVVIGNNSKEKAEMSLAKLRHRGPDSSSVQTFENISIGFTRLAINDKTSKGNQPFSYANYIGVFNAEIYNQESLIRHHKLTLNSQSDTEVILPLYEKYKENVIEHLDGFFAGVIYDKREKSIFFLRDYLGKKPLFFAYDNNNYYIVSELKALPKVKNFEIIEKGFSKLHKNQIQLIKTYTLSSKDVDTSLLKEHIYKAVEKRIVGLKGMKFGIFLSGGLDSSIIATIVNKLVHSKQVKYYAIADTNYQDLDYINIVKEFLNIRNENITWIELPNKNEFPSIIGEVLYATESINPSIISNGIGAYLLSRKAHDDGIKVVLTGDGADEFFLGYQESKHLPKTSDWKHLQQDFIHDLHMTELRRIDLACMRNSIEVRCPFLDRAIYNITLRLNYNDFFGNDSTSLNKNILRKLFHDELPTKIVSRKKVSLDVGSGLQKMMVDLAIEQNLSEEDYLKNVWNRYFSKTLSNVSKHQYFWSYPQFDKVIKQRGSKYEQK